MAELEAELGRLEEGRQGILAEMAALSESLLKVRVCAPAAHAALCWTARGRRVRACVSVCPCLSVCVFLCLCVCI